MKTQNVDGERGTQSAANSYKHAMRNGTNGQSVADAERQYNAYIESELRQCTIDGLAHALHAVQDSTAAGHAGFQPWDGGPLPSWKHMEGDMGGPHYAANWEDGKQKTRELLARFKRMCPCACKK